MKKDAWDKFMHTGSVNDYLSFKKKQKKYLNEMGTDVIIMERDIHGRNNRRDRIKNK